ncbi:MAG: ribonuclease R [Lachnospiraceae bacterium]|nr:ribonuclease R [Lachnospiraceae bacterium]
MDTMFERRKELICQFVEEERYVPMKEKEMVMLMQVKPEDKEEFHKVIDALLEEGRIMKSAKGKLLKGDGTVLKGTFLATNRGFGFVEVEGRTEDLFIPVNCVNGAFHKDVVQVMLRPAGRMNGGSRMRQEAEIRQILSHGITKIVGTYEPSKTFGFVLPDDTKIPFDVFVDQKNSMGAVEGHKVVVKILDYGGKGRKPEGQIVEILGHINDPGVDILSIVRGYELPMEFDERVLNQANRVAHEVSEADKVGRTDLRNVQMITIDGEDAKDLDDAVSLSMEGALYHLGVHIADVANYVQENSALDREALKRGTSVYLVDRVIPMLPHTLSNGICSLNAGEERLALSCLMTIDQKGEVIDHQIVESVIRVDRRMSYNQVKKILEAGDTDLEKECGELIPMLKQMEQLARILRYKRHKRGSIDFDFPESKIYLDKEGHPLQIQPYERNVATRLIEDFMLIANETVAQHYYWMESPFVYRTHGIPDPDKIKKLSLFIHNFGYGIKTSQEEIHPKEIQKLIEKIEGTDEEALISRLTLRSMKQAKYTVDCTGHFGLACKFYCHFTSPIRRYPDLQIHRIIKDDLRGRLSQEKRKHYEQILPEVARQSSIKERRADEAERETDKLKKAEYMESRIGEVFEGVISGITSWGIYVELANTIEGLIPVSLLPDDYYYYDESSYEMVGEDTGRRYKLGERVFVKVKSIDRLNRTIDFLMVDSF